MKKLLLSWCGFVSFVYFESKVCPLFFKFRNLTFLILLKLSRTKICSTPYFSHAISLVAYILHNSCPTSSICWLESPTRSWNRDYINWPLPPLPVLRNWRTWIRRHLDPLPFQDCLLSLWLTCQSITKEQAITSNLADWLYKNLTR